MIYYIVHFESLMSGPEETHWNGLVLFNIPVPSVHLVGTEDTPKAE